jgi:hypothetical protein
MQAISEIQLQSIKDKELQSTVTLGLMRGPEPVSGHVLEAQFRLDNKYLILVTDGSPLEEVLHFHLLDAELRPVDKVSLGRMYNAGIVKDLEPTSANTLTFSFFGDEVWQLEMLAGRRLSFHTPLLSAVQYPGVSLKGHRLFLSKLKGQSEVPLARVR